MQLKNDGQRGEGSVPTSIGIKLPNRFKYRHNAQFTILVFIFSATPNRSNPVTMHNLPSLISFSLQFQIVSNTVRIYALETLFSKGFLRFRIVSNTVTMHALETSFSCACLKDIVFKNKSAVTNRF